MQLKCTYLYTQLSATRPLLQFSKFIIAQFYTLITLYKQSATQRNKAIAMIDYMLWLNGDFDSQNVVSTIKTDGTEPLKLLERNENASKAQQTER